MLEAKQNAYHFACEDAAVWTTLITRIHPPNGRLSFEEAFSVPSALAPFGESHGRK